MATRKAPKLLKSSPSAQDPTLPTHIVSTADGEIRLCLDFGALIDTEAELIAAGHHDISLLTCLQFNSASALRTFFVIAAQRFHSKLGIEHLKSLVTYPTLAPISEAIAQLWVLSMPKPKKTEGGASDPLTPAE
jgi:hypothetical protein